MSPKEAIQSFGTESQVRPIRLPCLASTHVRASVRGHLITEISGWVASSVCVKT
jgi:hypothetical protein